MLRSGVSCAVVQEILGSSLVYQLLDSGAWPSLSVGMVSRKPHVFAKHHLVILIGEAQNWISDLKERSAALQVNGGFEKGADL